MLYVFKKEKKDQHKSALLQGKYIMSIRVSKLIET